MHPDYNCVANLFVHTMQKLGFEELGNDDFSMTFINKMNWSVVLEGEPYYRPAYDIIIVPPMTNARRKRYVLRLIQQCFHETRGEIPPKSSLNDDLRFLEEQQSYVFAQDLPYRECYMRINTIQI